MIGKLLRTLTRRNMVQWNKLALSYGSAKRIAMRKSNNMALYLRERRDPSGMRRYHRQKHLELARVRIYQRRAIPSTSR